MHNIEFCFSVIFMDSELTIILKMIKQKTGLEIDAFSESKKFTASTREEADLTPPSESRLDDVFSDVIKGKTFFPFRFRNAKLIGSIDGAGETEKNYAYFITSMLEGTSVKEDNASRGEQLKSIISGDYSRQQIQKFMHRYAVPDARCFALVLTNDEGKTEKVMEEVSKFFSNDFDSVILTEDMSCSLIKFITEETEADPVAFAHAVLGAIRAESGIEVNIGVSGIVNNLLEINNAYVQAVNALRMSRVLSANAGVHSYKDYMLVKMLEDIPKFKLSEYLDLLISEESRAVFRDGDMLLTAESFLENDLNVSETARHLYMHRNTLIYRIDKIMKETNLDIRRFSDAVTFRLIAIMLKIIG